MKVEMPHPDNPGICKGRRYPHGTWEAEWFRQRFDHFTSLVQSRKEGNEYSVWAVGGDSKAYLTDEEANAFAEAADQVAYAERCRAIERVEKKRKERKWLS